MINNKVFWGIVTAAAAGAVIGLLFAPDEGARTRKKIRKSADDWSHEALDSIESSKRKLVDAAKKIKQTANHITDEAKQKLDDVKS